MATKLHILSPCHEKWSKMTTVRHDCRHCAACEKQIVDFTMKSDAEILLQLSRSQGKICGRFRHDQLERSLEVRATTLSLGRKTFTAIAASFAAVLAAQQPVSGQTVTPVGTEQTPKQDCRIPLKVEPEIKDSIRTISGKVIDEDGESLIGVNVYFAQTQIGVASGTDGFFSLNIPFEVLRNNPLEIRLHYVGYFDKIISIPKQILLEDLALIPAQTQLRYNEDAFKGLIGEVEVHKYSPKSRFRHFFRKLFR